MSTIKYKTLYRPWQFDETEDHTYDLAPIEERNSMSEQKDNEMRVYPMTNGFSLSLGKGAPTLEETYFQASQELKGSSGHEKKANSNMAHPKRSIPSIKKSSKHVVIQLIPRPCKEISFRIDLQIAKAYYRKEEDLKPTANRDVSPSDNVNRTAKAKDSD